MCLDLSQVGVGQAQSNLAVAIVMVCASAFLDAKRRERAQQARAAGREPDKTTRGNDECWRGLPIPGLAEYYQSAFKLSRDSGVQHILALHRLSDLRAAGDDGSRQQRLAQGLLAEASTTVVYRQHAQEVPDTADALGLSTTARDRIARLPAGVALWVVGGRCFEVRHLLSDREWQLIDTDAAMGADQHARRPATARTPAASSSPPAGRRHEQPRAHAGGGDIAVARGRARARDPRSRSSCSRRAIAGLLADGHPVALGAGDALGVARAAARPRSRTRRSPGPDGCARQLPGALRAAGRARRLDAARARRCRVCWSASWSRRLSAPRPRSRRALGLRAASSPSCAPAGRRRGGSRSASIDGKLIAAERRVSVLGVGPAQSGKSTGLIVPAILEWHGPVLSTSIKSDVVHDTHTARGARSVRCSSSTRPRRTGLPHTPWSPIAAASTWEGARRTAANLLGVADQGAARNTDDAFWKPAGARFLAPLLLAAAHGQLTMADVLRWIAAARRRPSRPSCSRRCPNPGAQAGPRGAAVGLEGRPPASLQPDCRRSRPASTPGRSPRSPPPPSGRARSAPQRLLDGGASTLYLVAPAHEQRRLRGLFTALVADITAGAFERSAHTGRPIDPPLLLALDEAANIAPLPNLDEIASTGPGQGVQLLTILQNISQAIGPLGQRPRRDDHRQPPRPPLLLSGIGDRATLDYLRQTLGDEEIDRISTHRQSPLATGSRTYSSEFRTLAAPHRVRQADTNTALLVYGRLAARLGRPAPLVRRTANSASSSTPASPPSPPPASDPAAAVRAATAIAPQTRARDRASVR